MKLVLMSLVIELCLARLFAGSWGLAALLVVIYCIIVYIVMSGRVLLSKQGDNAKRETGYTIRKARGENSRNDGYTMYHV